MSQKSWHSLNIEEALKEFGSSRQGLSREEAAKRLLQYGPNELTEEKKTPPWMIFLSQFKSFLIVILIGAVILSAIIGETVDAAVIMIIIIFVGVLGFIQEYKAEKAMEALKKMAALTATVVRGGQEEEIPSRELVPGDIILLNAGDRVAADARLLVAASLHVEEAPLTGESVPVNKVLEPIPGDVPVGDRKNMVYSGTTITFGRGSAMVAATGMATEFGKIAGMLQEVEEKETPLQANLDRLGKMLAFILLPIAALVAGLGLLRGHEILEMLIWGVSLAVAAVPEALPAVVTISLAVGVQKMVKRHALVRKLPAVETLGCTTVICSDKTGTLTQDEMTVRQVYLNDRLIEVSGVGYEPKGEFLAKGVALDPTKDKHLQRLLEINALCNDSHLAAANGLWDIKGDPTEGALVVVAAKGGVRQEEKAGEFPRVDEIPFSSERKRMTTVHAGPKGKVAFAKGAPEVILNSCNRLLIGVDERPLTAQEQERILGAAQQMAGNALRVLGMAYKPLPAEGCAQEEAERDMVFAGLSGMIDPPREEAKRAIELCDKAGIKSVMITGDHKLTAMAVAKELGLLKGGLALSGAELDALSDEEFGKIVDRVEVYARVSPAHKMRVVEALQHKGHVVAMTGDGVNDAPALKKADIGVAMGITGTDVTKEAAAMVLTDDNFASIVAAVEEGRGIFGNIKKYLTYLLSCNLGEILLMVIAVLAGLPLPLVAVQILWVNLATDGLPAVALSVDPPEPDIMNRPPRDPKQSIFTRPVLKYLAVLSLLTGLLTLAAFLWAYKVEGKSIEEARTITFLTLVLAEFFNAFNCRSEKYSVFKVGFFKNKWLLLAMAWETALLILIVYLPFLHEPFNTFPLSLQDWLEVLALSSPIFIIVEIWKLIASWREKKAQAATT